MNTNNIYTSKGMPTHEFTEAPWQIKTSEELSEAKDLLAILKKTKQGTYEPRVKRFSERPGSNSVLIVEDASYSPEDTAIPNKITTQMVDTATTLFPDTHVYFFGRHSSFEKLDIPQERLTYLSGNTYITPFLSTFKAVFLTSSLLAIDCLIQKVEVHTFSDSFFSGRGLTIEHSEDAVIKEKSSLLELIHYYFFTCSRYKSRKSAPISAKEFFIRCHLEQSRVKSKYNVKTLANPSFAWADLIIKNQSDTSPQTSGDVKNLHHGFMQRIHPSSFHLADNEILNPSYICLSETDAENISLLFKNQKPDYEREREFLLFHRIRDELLTAATIKASSTAKPAKLTKAIEASKQITLTMLQTDDEDELNEAFDKATSLSQGSFNIVYIAENHLNVTHYIKDNADLIIRAKHLHCCLNVANSVINYGCPTALLAVLLDKKVIDTVETNYSGLGFTEYQYAATQSRIDVPFYIWFNYVIAHSAIYSSKKGGNQNVIEFLTKDATPFTQATYWNKTLRAAQQLWKRYIVDEF